MTEKTRQSLIARGGGNFVYVPKAVALGLGIEWAHVPIKRAVDLGASFFHVKEEGNGIVAKWPQFFFDLAALVERSFPPNQVLWQPRDSAVFQQAVRLHRDGRGDEAVALCAQHQGVPSQEMPKSILHQAGIGD